jgi:hypothetical protein
MYSALILTNTSTLLSVSKVTKYETTYHTLTKAAYF